MDAAEDRYRRVTAAVTALSELSAGPHGAGPAGVIAGDDMVLARMWAAAGVVGAAGMPVRAAAAEKPTAAELLSEAVGWQRYARGPVSVLHAECGSDISRGLLRLWARRQDRPAAQRAGLRQARIQLSGRVRTGCATLRAELRADAARVGLGRTGAFRDDVERQVQRLGRELRDAVEWELHGIGPVPASHCPAGIALPPPGAAGLENRLTLLLGCGFGTGAALTLGRVWAQFLPGPNGLVTAVSAALGVVLGGWVVRTRRLLVERAVLDRWVCEVTAALRSALEEHVAVRMLDVEAATSSPDRVRRFRD